MADVSQLTASTSQNSNGAGGGGILSRLVLDLRGSRFVIERETLMNLPESVLLCLFPNGLVLSRQSQGGGPPGFHHQPGQDGNGEDEDEEEVYMVEVSLPFCLCDLPFEVQRCGCLVCRRAVGTNDSDAYTLAFPFAIDSV